MSNVQQFEMKTWAAKTIRPQVEALLPSGARDWPAFEVALRSAVSRDVKIRDAIAKDPTGAMLAVVRCAQLGLSLAPAHEHFALVPFKGQIQGMIMFRGYIHMAMESGQIEWMNADVVYRQEYDRTRPLQRPDGSVDHVPHAFERDSYGDDAIVGAYASVKLRGSDRYQTAFLGIDRIKKLRQMGSDGPAWQAHFPAMCRAKAIKALCRTGFVPLGAKARDAVNEPDADEVVVPTVARVVEEPEPRSSFTLPPGPDAGERAAFDALDQDPFPSDERQLENARAEVDALAQQAKITPKEWNLITTHCCGAAVKIDDLTVEQANAVAAYIRKDKDPK